MSILNTLQKIKDEGFDPKKDSINGSGGLLPAGKYPVALQSAQHGATRSGQEQVSVGLEVVSGENKGRRELIFLGFEPSLPEFVLEKNGKILMALFSVIGIEPTQGDLADYESTADALKRGIGKQFLMDLTVTENKKNPQYPYRNYEFGPLEHFESENDIVDMGEEELPFL